MSKIIKILSNEEIFNKIIDTLKLKEKEIKVNPLLGFLAEGFLTIIDQKTPVEEKIQKMLKLYEFLKDFVKEQSNVSVTLKIENLIDILKIVDYLYEQTKRNSNNRRKYYRIRDNTFI